MLSTQMPFAINTGQILYVCMRCFLGPIEQAKPWNTAGISGVYSFLNKFWRLFHDGENFQLNDTPVSKEALKVLHKNHRKGNPRH